MEENTEALYTILQTQCKIYYSKSQLYIEQEVQMVQVSSTKEVERLKQNLMLQGQKLDAAQHRVAELETQLSKKEHLIAEQKKFLEDVKGQAKYG